MAKRGGNMEVEAMSIRITEHKMDGNWIRELGCGLTVAEAIRASGLSCETCEHWRRESKRRWNSHDPKDGYWDSEWFVCEKRIHQAQNKGSTSMSGGLHLHTHGPDFFCARHSALAEDKGQ